MPVGFQFSKIIIIESLEPNEVKTGLQISDFIKAELENKNQTIPVEYIKCWNAIAFIQLLDQIAIDAALGVTPIIHIECHGDPTDGLEFENGSNLSWGDLAGKLKPINIATKFNLLVLVSACFGAYFTQMINAHKPSPCWGVIAPTDTVVPYEIRSGFHAFYSKFLETWDLGFAITSLKRAPISTGQWFAKPAESLFDEVVMNYLESWCAKSMSYARVAQLQTEMRSMNIPHEGMTKIKRNLRQLNANMLDKYFSIYFSVGEIPENTKRFASVKASLNKKIQVLRASGKFLL
jgi:hypothetical protein